MAYSPIARAATTEKKRGTDNVLETETLQALAVKYSPKTAVQIVLGWAINRGYGIIPKSANLERQRQNFQVHDIKLTKEEIDSITALGRNQKICYRDEFVFYYNIFA